MSVGMRHARTIGFGLPLWGCLLICPGLARWQQQSFASCESPPACQGLLWAGCQQLAGESSDRDLAWPASQGRCDAAANGSVQHKFAVKTDIEKADPM